MATRPFANALSKAKQEFLAQWGALGPSWGVSRTMSQIHALLMVSAEPQNTDEIMQELRISRGSAHGNLQELCRWGLLRRVVRPGDRKEYFEAEKDVWRALQCIIRERKRKELEPVLAALESCLDQTRGLRGRDAEAFRGQLGELKRLAELADGVMERVGSGKSAVVLPWILKFLK